MKIIFVSNICWSLYNFRRGLMLEIKNKGHEVFFCAAEDEYKSRLEQLGLKYIPISLDRKGTNIFNDFFLLLSLVKIYKRIKPDWIFHNSIKPNIYGAIAALLTKNKCINTVSGLGYLFIRKNFLFLLVKNLYKFASKQTSKTFFQNKDDLQLFLENKMISLDKCLMVPGSGVNIDYFKPAVKQNHLSKNEFTFLYLGRILWDKGIGELIESIKVLKEKYPFVKVNFLGMIDKGNPAGISFEQIQDWESQNLIKYCGNVVDVKPYLEKCDCVVLPSYREGIPKALLEAAAMELPVIATDVAGCKHIVQDKVTGFLVPAKNVPDLTKAMEDMVKMPLNLREQMGKKAREMVCNEYSEKIVIKTYCEQIGL